ncbi:hypothetical protein BD289DRAFT_485587 [Coniella lustricola]|uniref:SnoaL-like domain-containing protein n=1 Tax=Coniella lustricola TaxID=2025994 RepID=A0A2T2ZY43_9PEZI|nr:hypothetical protein BD289DRAFT_485587 [Coniella lustricola]
MTELSPRSKLATEMIGAYRSWDLDKIISLRADDCITTILPKSLEVPPMKNDEYKKFFSFSMPLFKNFNPKIIDIVDDEKANKVAVWCESTADSVVGPYTNEYVITMHFNETCDKVVRFYEFVDSHRAKTHFAQLREWSTAQEAAKAAGRRGSSDSKLT